MIRNYQNPIADAAYQNYLLNPEQIPFSFTYGGEKILGFGKDHFALLSQETQTEEQKETTLFAFQMADGLTVEIKLTHYFSHGVTEFTVFFENTAEVNSALIEYPHIEAEFTGENPVLKGILGDHDMYYQPYTFDFAEPVLEFKQTTGKCTEEKFPYFNLEHGNGGTILVIGWGGTWSARFEKTKNGVRYCGNSVNDFCSYLKPGEKIRTALFVMAHYTVRNEDYATNYWRDWYIKHNLPKANAQGNPLEPFSTVCLADDTGRVNSDGSISEYYGSWKPSMEKWVEEKVDIDFRWVDAGWYQRPDGESAQSFVPGYDWSTSVGTWILDPAKWPGDSFKESVEFGHQHGIKTLLWFEPERTYDVSNMVKNHGYKKEWAINPADMKGLFFMGTQFAYGAAHYYDVVSDSEITGVLNNIGNEECRKYTTDRICKLLRHNKIDMYREDRNGHRPAALWHQQDINFEGENRFGITEAKAVDGHYKMWDDILACTTSYGGAAYLDNCSSGGCRNDLESLRRGVPLLRSDFDRTTIGVRLSISSSFNKWIPFCGSSTRESHGEHTPSNAADSYILRASYLPILNVATKFAYHETNDFSALHAGIAEWKKINRYLLKEFYVHTDWHHRFDESNFTAFSYFDPETETGILLAFRQSECNQTDLTVTLPYLENGAEYLLTDEDTKEVYELNGRELSLHFASPRSEKLIWIQKK